MGSIGIRSQLVNGLNRNRRMGSIGIRSEWADVLNRNSIGVNEWARSEFDRGGRMGGRRGLEVRGSDAAVKIFPAVSAKC